MERNQTTKYNSFEQNHHSFAECDRSSDELWAGREQARRQRGHRQRDRRDRGAVAEQTAHDLVERHLLQRRVVRVEPADVIRDGTLQNQRRRSQRTWVRWVTDILAGILNLLCHSAYFFLRQAGGQLAGAVGGPDSPHFW